MIQHFRKLNDHEVELMLKAPVLVSILIAGADGQIDDKEIKEVITFAEKQTRLKSPLGDFFREVSQDFEDKIKVILQAYPYESGQRAPLIVEELSALNAILPKMDQDFAREFYASLKSIARRIATSSGGLLGMNSVADEEAKYLELTMIVDPGEDKKQ
jgi:hypothetical protein